MIIWNQSSTDDGDYSSRSKETFVQKDTNILQNNSFQFVAYR
jgi:hypothetical protein